MPLSHIEQLIEHLESFAARRRQLGDYNADAPAIMRLTEILLLLAREVLQLRKELWRMKLAKKKKP